MDSQGADMNLLPDELLDMVFQYLSTAELLVMCARVDRRWRRVAERRALALRERGDHARLTRGTRAVLLTAFPVDLCTVLSDISARARLLREFTAHAAAPLHDAHVAALAGLPLLAHLDVFLRPRLLDQRHAPLLARLRSLVANESIGPGLLRALAPTSRLVALHMYGRAVHYPRRELLAALRARAAQLQELTLRCTELPDDAYEAVGACTALRSLRLYSCWLLRAAGARALCRARRLRVLHVTGARLLRARALADMLVDLPAGLRDVALSSGWFGDDHVEVLSQRAPDLVCLELWHCKLSAAGAQELAGALPRLERLDLSLVLARRSLRALARHPALRLVRCSPEAAPAGDLQQQEERSQWDVDGLRVVSVQAPYARQYFRPGSEGFRSTLFYYWTSDIPLEPLPPHVSPGHDPFDEHFY